MVKPNPLFADARAGEPRKEANMSKQEIPRATLHRSMAREGAAFERADFVSEDERCVTVTVRTASIKTPSMGKNLSFTFAIDIRTTVTAGLIQRLGFDAHRLFELGIVPTALPLGQTTLVREAPAEEEGRLKRRLLEQHVAWAKSQDFNGTIMNQISHFVRRGPESRLQGMDTEQAHQTARSLPTDRRSLL